MRQEIYTITTTVDGTEKARQLATRAVEGGLAACAQIDAGINSIYVWEGKLQESAEMRITFKTSQEQKEKLLKWILAHHPYEVPEMLVCPVESANPAYTKWVENM